MNAYIKWFERVGSDDTGRVGGKNASLGEMLASLKEEGIRVPEGFATTAAAYRKYVEVNEIEAQLKSLLDELDNGDRSLQEVGRRIRRLFRRGDFPEDIETEIRKAYRTLSERYEAEEVDVAVRSSATAEDLPEASFAGQQETFLNVSGEDDLLEACRKCYASLFTDRAIAYRQEQGFEHLAVALSVGVQKMVRSDKSGAGVLFTLDTDSGFPDVVVINAAWGLGENVVQGSITPDEYVVFKPLLENTARVPLIAKTAGEKEKKMVYAEGGDSTTRNVDTSSRERRSLVLSDGEILQLARWGCAIESHYGKPMDVEWAKDGDSGDLFIVQARPETVQSQKAAGTLKQYRLEESGERIVQGLAIGQAIAAGKACRIQGADEMDRFEEGGILVTGMTDPDWVPIMKRAAGIVTDHGGRTSHAAIVSRELGIPAIVGTGEATENLQDGAEITISCAEGDTGFVYAGLLEFEEDEFDLDRIPDTRTRIMINMASPEAAFRWWQLPCEGVGLARMEYVINNVIQIHPLALARFEELEEGEDRDRIESLTRGYPDKNQYFVEHLARGLGRIAAVQYPKRVIVRMSDFKTNEYADLIGGSRFEPQENNPMLGFRGASRYYSEAYRDGFQLECRAIRHLRETMGFDNVCIMIPFCRTPQEADRVYEAMAEAGLERGKNGLEVYVMAEVPSNIFQAEEFAERFDGFSIGSNDLTQLVLGVDRDSEEIAELFDERSPAVKQAIAHLIRTARQADTKVGICGQAPSDYPEFAAFLVESGIDSISLNPDSLVQVKQRVAEVETKAGEENR